MATEEYRRKIAILDWENEKACREKTLNDPNASDDAKENARKRIEEADAMLKKLRAMRTE